MMPLAAKTPPLPRPDRLARAAADTALMAEIRAGLAKPQKELPSRLLYDELGTALFEALTLLPEYGLTRADQRLLEQQAGAIARLLPERVLVTELGSGSGRKTRPLLAAVSRRAPVNYFPIDVSAAALDRCRRELLAEPEQAADSRGIHIVGLEGTYLEKLREAVRRRQPGEAVLVLFLGSTIGNFDRGAAKIFLWRIRSLLRRGDFLLLGADLEKPAAQLLAAYADALGITAAFNLNLLRHLNRDFGGNFALESFRHQARYNAPARRIEMHLVAQIPLHCRAAGLEIELAAGETIWTESSHKFTPAGLRRMAAASGFRPVAEWRDAEWPFCEALWRAEAQS